MSLEKTGVQLVAEGASAFLGDMGHANQAVIVFGSAADHAIGGVNAFQEATIGALRRVGELAVDALGKATQAVGGFVSDSVSAAGDFEAGMNKFQAVAGAGVDTAGLAQFKDLFISLGRELPVSTAEVQAAAVEMVSGGIDPAIVKGGALRQTLQFAAASGLSLADAAATSAKFLAGWTSSSATAAEKVDFLASSTDALTKAAAASSTTVAELRLGIFNVQGAAQALHAPFEDVVATLAELAPAFESSAQAGTALNVFMTRLVPSTAPATDAMKELGIITKDNQNLFFDTQGRFLGMSNAAQVLKDKLGGLSDEQKISYLHTLFGNDAQKVANLLMQDGAAGIEAIKTKMSEANGVSATAALMQSGYNTALENAKGSVEALQITLGSYFLPILTDLLNNVIAPGINQLTTLADVLGGNTQAVSSLWPAFQTLATLLQPIIAGFGSGGLAGALAAVVTQIDTLLPGFSSVVSWLQGALSTAISFVVQNWTALQGALVAVGAVLVGAAVAGAILSVAGTIAALANPITLIIGMAAALGAAWATDFGGIRTILTDFWNTTGQPIFSQVVTWLQTNIPAAITTVSAFWTGTLQPAINTVWGFISNSLIPTLVTLVTGTFATVNAGLQTLAGFWTGTLQPALNSVWSFLNTYVIPLFGALVDVHLAAIQRGSKEVSDFWTGTLKPALDSVWGFIDQKVVPVLSKLSGDALKSVYDKSKEVSDFWNSTLKPAFDAISSFIGTTLKPAWDGLADIIGSVGDKIGGLGSIIGGAIDWLHRLADAIRGTPSMPDVGGSTIPHMASGVRDFVGGLAVVGEQGPELAAFPRGTTVYPAATTKQMLNGAVRSAFQLPRISQPATPMQIMNQSYRPSSNLIFNIDARGANLSEAQIERAVYAGIATADRTTGSNVDARLRTGA